MKDLVIDVHAHFIPALLYERFDAKAFPNVNFDQTVKRMPAGEGLAWSRF